MSRDGKTGSTDPERKAEWRGAGLLIRSLVSRIRSSQHLAAPSEANFAFVGH